MDDLKDVSKKEQASRFLDNRTLRVQPFGANVSADRAYRRAERLVAAIHLVSNHIWPEEPVRVSLRRAGLELLSSILVLRNELRASESVGLKKVQTLIRELISFIRILSVAGHVSLQNAEILVEALDELAHFLSVSQRTTLSEGVAFVKDEFLDTGYTTLPHSRNSDSLSVKERVSIKDKSTSRKQISNKTDSKRQRSDQIIVMLTSQGQLGIKDIAASLPEYSEKMIQRELKNLVTLGRVKKTGSKRWSTYALA